MEGPGNVKMIDGSEMDMFFVHSLAEGPVVSRFTRTESSLDTMFLTALTVAQRPPATPSRIRNQQYTRSHTGSFLTGRRFSLDTIA